MKQFFILLGALSCVLVVLTACTDLDFAPPPVTKELVRTGGDKRVTVQQLESGRRLFVSRCIECHTLPVATRFTESEWPCIVYEMGKRAALKPEEHEAVLAYILAIRAQHGRASVREPQSHPADRNTLDITEQEK